MVIFERPSLPVLLRHHRTLFLIKESEAMFPAERRIVGYNLQPVPIVLVTEATIKNETIRRTTAVIDGGVSAVEAEDKGYSERVAWETILQLISEPHVSVTGNESGIVQADLYKLIRL